MRAAMLAPTALLLVLAAPGTSFAINFCSSTNDPCGAPIEVAAGSTVSIDLFFNSSISVHGWSGNVTTSGSTIFESAVSGSSPLPSDFCALFMPGGPAQFWRWSCGSRNWAPAGSYHFATLNFTAGEEGDNIILTGGTYQLGLSDPEVDVDNVGATLVTVAPEPSTALLLVGGLVALASRRRRRAVARRGI